MSLVNGTQTPFGTNILYRFTSGTGSITFASTATVQVLIVGGGGGGGAGRGAGEGGGGGGAGGVGVGTLTFVGGVTYNITVGNGGTGGTNAITPTIVGTNGSNSTIVGGSVNETAYGGGKGGSADSTITAGGNGGSGGGSNGGWNNIGPRGSATKGAGSLTYYGNGGGIGMWNGGSAGGGGASAAGANASSSNASNGGAGYTWSVTGSTYGGGGGGGGYFGSGNAGTGGNGGGGKGGGVDATTPTSGTANTGGGGGGGYLSTGVAGSGGSGVVIILGPKFEYPCFLEGSKILRLNPETDNEEYTAVEKLRRGDLIKTLLNGYKAIHSIGHKILPNPATDKDKRNRLYRFSKQKCPDVNRDLYITGEHCTLRLDLTYDQVEHIKDHMGRYYITDKHFRCPACLDERADPYDREDKPVTIWHFALEHYDAYLNYGIYANGLLVESCSIEYLVKKSNMKLI